MKIIGFWVLLVLCAVPIVSETIIDIDENSRWRLVRFTDPDLNIFREAAGIFKETGLGRREFEGGPFPGKFSIGGKTLTGILHMPGYEGYDYISLGETKRAKNDRRKAIPVPRGNIEKSLALGSLGLQGQYLLGFSHREIGELSFSLQKDIFLRGAFNFYDFAPLADTIKSGNSILDFFSTYYSGGSFARYKDTTTAYFHGYSGGSGFRIFASRTTTDFLFQEHSLGFEMVSDTGFRLVLAYDFASYDSFNGVPGDKVRVETDMGLSGGANIFAEAHYLPDRPFPENIQARIGLKISYSSESAHKLPEKKNPLLEAPVRTAPVVYRLSPSKYRIAAIDADIRTILDLRNYDVKEITDIFATYDDMLLKYDPDRSVDIFSKDRFGGKSPEDYLKNGGVCVDISLFIATVLENNGIEAKIIRVGSLRGSPHSYVAARDSGGGYYIVDGFNRTSRIPGAESFSSAADIYQQGFTQMVVSDTSGHIETVIMSPDIIALDRIMMR
jgi:hypothetical protein